MRPCDLPDQIGHEDEAALQQADHQEVAGTLIIPRDLTSQFRHAPGDRGRVEQHLGDLPYHLPFPARYHLEPNGRLAGVRHGHLRAADAGQPDHVVTARQ